MSAEIHVSEMYGNVELVHADHRTVNRIAIRPDKLPTLFAQILATRAGRAQLPALLRTLLQSEAAQCTAVGMLQAAHEQAEAEAPPFHWTLEDEHGETMYGD